MSRIAAVVFDYGNVLSLRPEPSDFRRLQLLTGFDEEAFSRLYWLHREDYDRGVFDGPGYWASIGEAGGTHFASGKIQKLIAEDIALWTRVNPALLVWARSLSQRGLRT